MRDKISIHSYGNYSNGDYGAHTLLIWYGPVEFYFSYSTLVAFRTPKDDLVCSENIWGNTTGKHLNWIEPDKKQRVTHDEFEKRANQLLSRYKLHISI
ncbi:MAG: hypothetical protein WC291_05685 [Thermodesulfovibrionales bacterium]|jgi:hypothetical protein